MFFETDAVRHTTGQHLLFAGEKTRSDHLLPAPEIQTVDDPEGFRVIELNPLVTMMLSRNRNEDGMYLRDLIAVGLLDASWLPNLPPMLAERLQHILNALDG